MGRRLTSSGSVWRGLSMLNVLSVHSLLSMLSVLSGLSVREYSLMYYTPQSSALLNKYSATQGST